MEKYVNHTSCTPSLGFAFSEGAHWAGRVSPFLFASVSIQTAHHCSSDGDMGVGDGSECQLLQPLILTFILELSKLCVFLQAVTPFFQRMEVHSCPEKFGGPQRKTMTKFICLPLFCFFKLRVQYFQLEHIKGNWLFLQNMTLLKQLYL